MNTNIDAVEKLVGPKGPLSKLPGWAKAVIVITMVGMPTTLFLHAQKITWLIVQDPAKAADSAAVAPVKQDLELVKTVAIENRRSSRRTEKKMDKFLESVGKGHIVKESNEEVADEIAEDSLRMELGRESNVFENARKRGEK